MCVTGLVIVDTATYWSGFGQGVILLLIQLGGLGIMAAGALFGLATARRLELRSRLTTAAELNLAGFGDVPTFILGAVRISLTVEPAAAVVLVARAEPPAARRRTCRLGRPLGELDMGERFGVIIVAVRRRGQGFTHTTRDSVLEPGDVIIAAGRAANTERFSELPQTPRRSTASAR